MNKKYLAILFATIIIYTGCGKKIKVTIDNSKERYIIKDMSDKLIINLMSSYNKPVTVKIALSDITADYSDIPVYTKKFTAHKGKNYIILNMSDISLTKFRLTIFHHNDIVDSRIIEYIPKQRK